MKNPIFSFNFSNEKNHPCKLSWDSWHFSFSSNNEPCLPFTSLFDCETSWRWDQWKGTTTNIALSTHFAVSSLQKFKSSSCLRECQEFDTWHVVLSLSLPDLFVIVLFLWTVFPKVIMLFFPKHFLTEQLTERQFPETTSTTKKRQTDREATTSQTVSHFNILSFCSSYPDEDEGHKHPPSRGMSLWTPFQTSLNNDSPRFATVFLSESSRWLCVIVIFPVGYFISVFARFDMEILEDTHLCDEVSRREYKTDSILKI